MSTDRFIERQRGYYAVRELCQVLDVASSAYYAQWQQRQRPAPAWEWAGSLPAPPGATALATYGLSCKPLGQGDKPQTLYLLNRP